MKELCQKSGILTKTILFARKSLLRLNMGGYLKKSREQSHADGCGEAGGEVPPIKSTGKATFYQKITFLSKVHPFYITPSFCTRREKIDLADSEKRTPEVKFRPFFIIIQKNPIFLKNPHCMALEVLGEISKGCCGTLIRHLHS